MGSLKELLARRCEKCPLCRYARHKPESLIGKIVGWHGKWCPCWRAWEEVYGGGAWRAAD